MDKSPQAVCDGDLMLLTLVASRWTLLRLCKLDVYRAAAEMLACLTRCSVKDIDRKVPFRMVFRDAQGLSFEIRTSASEMNQLRVLMPLEAQATEETILLAHLNAPS